MSDSPIVVAGSVAGQIVLRLRDRLLRVDGTNGMLNDVAGRVLLRRFNVDADLDRLPLIILRRRLGGGSTRILEEGSTIARTQVIFDAVGFVPGGELATIEGENMLADMYRAIEDPNDKYMSTLSSDGSRRTDLLVEELVVVDEQVDEDLAAMPLDIVGFGIQCTFEQIYGDPNNVR